jgi:hypothetical protein
LVAFGFIFVWSIIPASSSVDIKQINSYTFWYMIHENYLNIII